MAHEIESTDKHVYAKKQGWHGLGEVVEDLSIRDGFKKALPWMVEPRKIYVENLGLVPDYVANVREDTGEVLGVVGSGYEIFQNHHMMELLEGADVAKLETIGSLKGGRIVFALVPTGQFEVGVGGQDVVKQYSCITNRHDGTGALRVYDTSIRVVCANTEAAAEAGSRGWGYTIKHTRGIHTAVASLQEGIRYTIQGNRRMAEQCQALADKGLTGEALGAFFVRVWESVYGPVPEDGRRRDNAENTIGRWIEKMDEPNQTMAGIQGTAWSAYNCITEWADHERRTRRTAKSDGESVADARAYASLFGPAVKVKANAMKIALELL